LEYGNAIYFLLTHSLEPQDLSMNSCSTAAEILLLASLGQNFIL